jgi:hypothetical protein
MRGAWARTVSEEGSSTALARTEGPSRTTRAYPHLERLNHIAVS